MLIINEGLDVGTVTEKLGRLYVERGVVRWSFVDDGGEPVPVTRALLGRLNWDAIFPIANKAAELYSEALVRPLVAQASKSSSNGHTAPSTSPKSRRSPSRPRR
jgi:hypothetical protein